MHELGIAKALVTSTLGKLKEHNVEKVSSIKLKLGKLNMLTPAVLQSAFDLVSKGTPLAGARLKVEEVEGSEVSVIELEGEE